MEDKPEVVEVTYGAPDPPEILFARGVLHPHTLSDEITDVIFDILKDSLTRGHAISMAEVYRRLCAKGAMEFQREVYLAREHPVIKQIAGACQHLHFSGQLAEAVPDAYSLKLNTREFTK